MLERSAGDIYWKLIGPSGRVVVDLSAMNDPWGSDIEGIALPTAGTYTLLVEGRYYVEGSASYKFQLLPMGESTAPLAIGETISSSLPQSGALAHYTFTLDQRRSLVFDSLPPPAALNNNYYLYWSLVVWRGAFGRVAPPFLVLTVVASLFGLARAWRTRSPA